MNSKDMEAVLKIILESPSISEKSKKLVVEEYLVHRMTQAKELSK